MGANRLMPARMASFSQDNSCSDDGITCMANEGARAVRHLMFGHPKPPSDS
jgi:hypothetical protein